MGRDVKLLILAVALLLAALVCATFGLLFAVVGQWGEAGVLLIVSLGFASAASWAGAEGMC